jgi:hypothetical protein
MFVKFLTKRRTKMKKLLLSLGFAVLAMGIAGNASADSFTLDFEGLGNLSKIGNFYNGGAGTDYGVSFSDNALAIIDADAGGTGNIGGLPSPDTAMFFLGGSAAIMNVEDGFDTGFSFFYSAVVDPGYVEIYDDVNGSGNRLAYMSLAVTPFNGSPDPTGVYSPFLPVLGMEFEGIAKSVVFGGVIDKIGFDNVTFGSAVPPGGKGSETPEPATLFLLGSGLAGLAGFRKLKK